MLIFNNMPKSQSTHFLNFLSWELSTTSLLYFKRVLWTTEKKKTKKEREKEEAQETWIEAFKGGGRKIGSFWKKTYKKKKSIY